MYCSRFWCEEQSEESGNGELEEYAVLVVTVQVAFIVRGRRTEQGLSGLASRRRGAPLCVIASVARAPGCTSAAALGLRQRRSIKLRSPTFITTSYFCHPARDYSSSPSSTGPSTNPLSLATLSTVALPPTTNPSSLCSSLDRSTKHLIDTDRGLSAGH
jgi:hypothetical protein